MALDLEAKIEFHSQRKINTAFIFSYNQFDS